MGKVPEIVVKKVNIQQDEVDRLNNTIEMRDNTIKYQQDQYMKLIRKMDCQEPYGLNCLLFSFSDLVAILKNKYHSLHEYIYRWFEPLEDCDFEENKTLYFSEDGVEVKEGEYWLVNVKNDYACVVDDIEKLNRKIYALEKESDE